LNSEVTVELLEMIDARNQTTYLYDEAMAEK